MNEFHYYYIKNKYGNNSRLWLTDTDSLMHKIKSEDVYDDSSMDKEMSDISNCPAKLKYYDDSNKSVTGKMKDETASAAIKEIVQLKPKMNSFLSRW